MSILRIISVCCMLPAALGAQVTSTGGYIVRQDTSEIVREWYAFDGRVLTSTLAVPVRQLVIAGKTIYDQSLSPTEYIATGRQFSDSVPFQELRVTFGDSVAWQVTGAGAQTGATPLTRPYSVFRNLAFSHLAVTMLRYDRATGGRQDFQLWVPDGGVTVPLSVELADTEGVLRLRGLEIRVVLSDSGWLRRAEIPAQSVVVEWRDSVSINLEPAPPREPPAGVAEYSYEFTSGDLTLQGTLAVPAQVSHPVPVGAIVAGSGPTDRDGNSAQGLRTDMYAQLAWRLAERGVATLRYDKRGLGATRGTFDPSQVTFDDFVSDVVAATRALSTDERFSDVVVLGHSEGASLATAAANRGAPVAGIALLAGIGRPLLTVLREQLSAQLDSVTMVTFDSAMQRYIRGEAPGELPTELQVFFLPVNRRFMQTAVAFAPLEDVARVSVPVLIVQGGTDVQVSVQDAELLAQAKPDARLVVIPDANHVFKRAPDRSRASQVRQYSDPSLPIVPALVEAIAQWIGSLSSPPLSPPTPQGRRGRWGRWGS